MNEIVIKCHIEGTRPLLMNAFLGDEGGGPLRVGKTYIDEEEAKKRLYTGPDGEVCHPSTHLEACMVKSAGDFKFTGRKTYKDSFKSGVFVQPYLIPHLKAKWEIDRQTVVIQRSRILRCRPRFDNWELSFNILVRDDRIEPLAVRQVLEAAGKYVGIGDYRPRFGLFQIVEFSPL